MRKLVRIDPARRDFTSASRELGDQRGAVEGDSLERDVAVAGDLAAERRPGGAAAGQIDVGAEPALERVGGGGEDRHVSQRPHPAVEGHVIGADL